MNRISRIQAICDANGVSGFEDEVVSVIRKEAAGLGSFTEDSMRNLYLARKLNHQNRPIIQLDAHTDEVGFMVKCIREDGMLEFITIGGWVNSNIPAHMVRIRNNDGIYIPGLVGSKPPHYMTATEKNAVPDVSSMIIDIGASSAAEVINDFKIGIAAPIVPEATCRFDEKSELLFGKAFDCRLGCVSIIETFEALKNELLDVDVIAGFASQEEVGCRGAIVTSETINADLAICFEGCPADDTFVPAYQAQTVLKKGPMLRHFDSKMITNPRFQRFALDLAKECNIPVQEAVRSGGATNGSQIHIAHKSIPTIVIGIPVRYAHTHWCISSLKDVDSSIRLATELLKRLNKGIIASF
ncbi:M42 family peptidase [uncultured Sphaerochaeta sp.]|uniref:M42 family metallopeptidase n=1 Tax=uncultured Sphaerochaeta sp. TaxID=886478 RepID=UPI002A0A9ACA|nr:M42 family peptidase [uncultured Sphaerochaeta sp.]